MIVALVERVPLSQATATASDLSERFNLDISPDESGLVSGSDLAEVERECHAYALLAEGCWSDVLGCLAEFIRYCEMDLIDPALVSQIPVRKPFTKMLSLSELIGM